MTEPKMELWVECSPVFDSEFSLTPILTAFRRDGFPLYPKGHTSRWEPPSGMIRVG